MSLIKMIYVGVFLCVSCGYLPLTPGLSIAVKEDDTAVLTCSSTELLDISFANYRGYGLFCGDNEVTSIVQGQCQGKQTCTLHATDDIYTDSCLGPNEKLTITYICTAQLTTESVLMSTTKTNSSEAGRATSETRDSVPVLAVTAGCIAGLVLVVLITIAVCHKYKHNKQTDEHIHMTPLTGQIVNHDDDLVRTESTDRKVGHGNASTITYATATGAVGSRRKHSTESLPPSYDLATTGRQCDAEDNTDDYHSTNQYDHTKSFKKLKLTEDNIDGYDLATQYLQDSEMTRKSEIIYVNETVRQNGIENACMSNSKPTEIITDSFAVHDDLYCSGSNNVDGDNSESRNQYANIDIKDAKLQSKDVNNGIDKSMDPRYMAMHFTNTMELTADDNVYVPIMSPTSSG